MEFYKYQGAGNDFLIADNRDGQIRLTAQTIAGLCERHYGIGADGVMLLENAEGYDFKMVYFNSDGSGGMMCGNGGRCIAAFAANLGIAPSAPGPNPPSGATASLKYKFLAADGPHYAEISRANCGGTIVRLKMKDVDAITRTADGYFLDTGTRHLVKIVHNLEDYDVTGNGRLIRNKAEYGPIGTNVNFIQPVQGILHVRTYEKGVEAETFACGTGIVASAIAAYYHEEAAPAVRREFRDIICRYSDGRIHIDIAALRDSLSVDFLDTFASHLSAVTPSTRSSDAAAASDVWLTGPATFVAKILLPCTC